VAALGVDGFNKLSHRQRMHLLFEVCNSQAWARRVLAGGPFSGLDALLGRADLVLAQLSDAEIDAALGGHPRIGARVPEAGREQAAVAHAGDDVRAELFRKNLEYEQKFGYLYLVCASGRSGEELLSVLTDRLDNDARTERALMRDELAKINRLRLQRLLQKGQTPC
jgi:2-oxo-4-hydroxy-4-carboxy-5-ureidoimidazoline decarboxylase